MQRIPFEDKTNEERETALPEKKEGVASEKDRVVTYLKMVRLQTRDYSFKYDLNQCLEIIEGKENQQMAELKDAVNELAAENEELANKCTQLELQLRNREGAGQK